MKEYFGTREFGRADVFVRSGDGSEARPLAPRNDLRNDLVDHSQTGFEWGFGGSGPAHLALAILADALGDEPALALYQDFKWRFVARWPRAGWSFTAATIRQWHRQQVTGRATSAP